MKKLIFLLGILVTIAILVFLKRDKIMPLLFTPRVNSSRTETTVVQTTAELGKKAEKEVILENLEIPWEVVITPSNEMLITERPGRLLKFSNDSKKVHEISGVSHVGEGGLLGLALHPKYSENNYIYLYLTTRTKEGLSNRVERYTLDGDTLNDRKIILEGIAGASNHDGGRIAFGPDGYLYITTGDAEVQKLAQDKDSLNGKILRIKDDGSIPEDNPFNNEIYSYGHRNPQGIAWDSSGRLWATEHGPSGTQTGYDEVNLIQKGGNYGWPTYKGDQEAEGFIKPMINSGSKDTWAPAGLTIIDDVLYFTGLRGEAMYSFNPDSQELKSYFKKEFGRLRAITTDKNGNLYVATSNRDGRGRVNDNDDKLIRFTKDLLQ